MESEGVTTGFSATWVRLLYTPPSTLKGTQMGLTVIPISIREAQEFVGAYHRHNKPPQGAKFAIGAEYEGKLVGVAIVGRPVARMMNDGFTAEVTRVCVLDDAPKNSCSFLYGRCWRIWQQMGGKRMLTYTLQSEPGSSLKGAGWKVVGEVKPRSWNWSGRPREYQEIYGQAKFRWEVT
jgi:hypothetical protein